MRQEAYDKFASALMQKRAEARHQYVLGRLADMIVDVKMQKQAEARHQYVLGRLADTIVDVKMQKQAGIGKLLSRLLGSKILHANTLGGSLTRLGRRAHAALSPKIDASAWKKWDPRRLFLTTRDIKTSVRNTPTVPPAPGGGSTTGSGAYSGAYSGGGGGAPRPYADLPSTGGTGTTTRLSPGKILAALGITGGTAALASGGKDAPKVNLPPQEAIAPLIESLVEAAPSAAAAAGQPVAPQNDDIIRAIVAKIRENPGTSAAIAAGGTAAAGGLGYLAGSSGAPEGNRKRKNVG